MTKIMGIDPGLGVTGYGVILAKIDSYKVITSGILKTEPNQSLSSRLHYIFMEVSQIIAEQKPDCFAIEDIFVDKNIGTALKLGHARAAAMLAAANANLPIFEYEARKVKKSVAGSGKAEKVQIRTMVSLLTGIRSELKFDEADAIAVAICHRNYAILREQQNLIAPGEAAKPKRKVRRGRIFH